MNRSTSAGGVLLLLLALLLLVALATGHAQELIGRVVGFFAGTAPPKRQVKAK